MIAQFALDRLKRAAWLKRPETQAVFALLDGDRGRTRAVGGIVRDTLADRMRETPEIDFATELRPEEVTRRAKAAGVPVYPTGIEHGTVTLKVGDLVAEVTTLREDVETDGRRARVRFGRDWRRDAERRDFTLNALYARADGTLVDPLGGAQDCLDGVVRFIGDADRRIAEDRLRVYRFFRFSASHGHERFDPDGLAAVTRAAGTLDALSAERVGGEMRRMLGLPRVSATLVAMGTTGILAFSPDLLDQLGTYERHARQPNFNARLTLVIASTGIGWPRERWRLSNEEAGTAERTLAAARLLIEFQINEAAYRYPAVLADAVEVAAALAGWTEAGKSAVLVRLEEIEMVRFPVSGSDLIAAGMVPGRELGEELERLERRWIASSFRLGKAELLAELKR